MSIDKGPLKVRTLLSSQLSGPQETFVRGEDVYLIADNGRRVLDASSGVGVTCLGYSSPAVVEATTTQASQLQYAHALRFETGALVALANSVVSRLPGDLARAFFTSGGSEAVESAIKFVRQYWIEAGQPQRWRVVGRRPSFHGNTLATLSAGWHLGRRTRHQPLLLPFLHIDAPDTYRGCPRCAGLRCSLRCAEELESLLDSEVGEEIACFIAEPIAGASGGAIVPPDDYWPTIIGICNRAGIPCVADETLTGFGRTGKWFAIEHWKVTPDLLIFGKGISAGFAPLAGFGVRDELVRILERGSGRFEHNFTNAGHPVAAAAGVAAIREIERLNLIDRVQANSSTLFDSLEPLRSHELVGDIRGRGYLAAIELVKDKDRKSPFPRSARMAERAAALALSNDLLVYYGSGGKSDDGDYLLLMPAFIYSKEQIVEVGRRLRIALDQLAAEVHQRQR